MPLEHSIKGLDGSFKRVLPGVNLTTELCSNWVARTTTGGGLPRLSWLLLNPPRKPKILDCKTYDGFKAALKSTYQISKLVVYKFITLKALVEKLTPVSSTAPATTFGPQFGENVSIKGTKSRLPRPDRYREMGDPTQFFIRLLADRGETQLARGKPPWAGSPLSRRWSSINESRPPKRSGFPAQSNMGFKRWFYHNPVVSTPPFVWNNMLSWWFTETVARNLIWVDVNLAGRNWKNLARAKIILKEKWVPMSQSSTFRGSPNTTPLVAELGVGTGGVAIAKEKAPTIPLF